MYGKNQLVWYSCRVIVLLALCLLQISKALIIVKLKNLVFWLKILWRQQVFREINIKNYAFLNCHWEKNLLKRSFFLVYIFSYLDWIRRFTKIYFVNLLFNPTTEKYRPKETLYLVIFHAVYVKMVLYCYTKFQTTGIALDFKVGIILPFSSNSEFYLTYLSPPGDLTQ